MSLSITLSCFRIRNECHNGYFPPLLYTQAIPPASLFAILEFGMILMNEFAVENTCNTLYFPSCLFSSCDRPLSYHTGIIIHHIRLYSIEDRSLANFYAVVLIIVPSVYQVWNISIFAKKQIYTKMTPVQLLYYQASYYFKCIPCVFLLCHLYWP